ncbi:MAG TPA: DUF4332 domain-containing protein [Luteolibacter sp.]|nr:DUF4332 domain-containing protein [Luteolibacter sp.]
MSDLASIPGIGKTSLELLEAAGFLTVESLAVAKPDALAAELKHCNSILKIAKQVPSVKSIAQWIEHAREFEGLEAGANDEPQPAVQAETVAYEITPEDVSLIAMAPVAIPLPARILMNHQLAVGDIPPALLFNPADAGAEVRTRRHLPENRAAKTQTGASHFVRIAENAAQRLEIDTARLRTTSDPMPLPQRTPRVKASPSEDRLALIRAPRSETNKGRNPESRRYIRGVLHSHPVGIYAGAFVTLLVMLLTPLAVISAVLLLLSGEIPEKFAWVPGWLIVFPLVLPLAGMGYLIWGLSGSCRICGQGLFRHRAHLKNNRAHRVPGLGYIFPLCIHILLFHWFRCTHCGTPVRLKE